MLNMVFVSFLGGGAPHYYLPPKRTSWTISVLSRMFWWMVHKNRA